MRSVDYFAIEHVIIHFKFLICSLETQEQVAVQHGMFASFAYPPRVPTNPYPSNICAPVCVVIRNQGFDQHSCAKVR